MTGRGPSKVISRRRAAVLAAGLVAGLMFVSRDAPATTAPATVESGWLAGLVGRQHRPPATCVPIAAADSATQHAKLRLSGRPPIADYAVCDDQIALLSATLDSARASGRLVLVEFGATWCPSCKGLQAALRDPMLLGPDLASGTLSRRLVKISIGLSVVAGGRASDVDDGQAILTRLLASRPEVRLRAYPLIAILDPADPSRLFIRNLDDIVLDGGREPVDRLTSIIIAGADAVRSGSIGPDEPSWIIRKVSRLWQKIW